MEKELKSAFLNMKREEALNWVEKGLQSNQDPLRILDICRAAMVQIGEKFKTGDFFLSELIYSAQVFKQIADRLEPHLLAGSDPQDSKGVIVFGTPKGDIHDLGKNIVATMMRSFGFSVYDLGVDVPPENLVLEVQRREAPILALSALITPAFASMKAAIALLEKKGLREKTFVIIGGGVTTEFARKEIGADAQTLDPTEAVRLCSRYLEV